MGDVSAEIRKIIASVKDLASINRGNMNIHHELVGLMRWHSRCGDYLVKFVKQTLEAPCICVSGRLSLRAPFMLNQELTGSLPHARKVNLHIPVPVEVGEPQVYVLYLSRGLPATRLNKWVYKNKPACMYSTSNHIFICPSIIPFRKKKRGLKRVIYYY